MSIVQLPQENLQKGIVSQKNETAIEKKRGNHLPET